MQSESNAGGTLLRISCSPRQTPLHIDSKKGVACGWNQDQLLLMVHVSRTMLLDHHNSVKTSPIHQRMGVALTSDPLLSVQTKSLVIEGSPIGKTDKDKEPLEKQRQGGHRDGENEK